MNRMSSPHLAEAAVKASAHWKRRAERPTPTAFTVAISREAGALGSSVGREVAVRLGWQLYDQELVNRIGEEMGLRASLLQSVDEQATSWIRDLVQGFSSRKTASEPAYVRHLVEVVGALSRHGECVIVGRGAPHILPAEMTLRVRLVAPRAFRVGVAQQTQNLSAEDAGRWVDATDRERAAFVKQHFFKDPADPAQYDVVLSVERFTVNQCAGMIIEALRHLEENRRRA